VPSRLHEILDAIHRRPLAEPAIELERFAKEETWHQLGGADRRRFRRYSLITNVIVVPLDSQFCQAGDPFVALSSGMSIDGLRLIHTDPPASDYLFVEIEGQPVRFVLSVLRSRPLGPCCEIAGRLMNADLLNQASEPRITICRTNGGVDIGTSTDPAPPTVDEFVRWAGVAAALPLLRPATADKDVQVRRIAGPVTDQPSVA
jgi:hypothetical protein